MGLLGARGCSGDHSGTKVRGSPRAASFSSLLPVVLLSDKVHGEGKDLFKQAFFIIFFFFFF